MNEKESIIPIKIDPLEIAECLQTAAQEGRLRPHPMAVMKNKLKFLQEGLDPQESDRRAREQAITEKKLHGASFLKEKISCFVRLYETKAATEETEKLAQVVV